MLYCDKVAPTESEAVDLALEELRLSREDVCVRSVTETPEGVRVRIEANRSRGKEALECLRPILERMGVNAELFYVESFDKITINVKGPHLGLVIGKSGSTLEALETIVGAIHNRSFEYFKPVLINPGGYRENKLKALRNMVRRAVDEASTGERVSLPPMSQRDRRQVHEFLKEFPGFRSRSFDDGRDRRVCIFLATDEDEKTEPLDEEQFFLPPTEPPQSEGHVQSLP